MVEELRKVFQLTTGAELKVISPEEALAHDGVLINIGNWPGAREVGLVGSEMPIEGFAIKTAPNQIFIVGHDDFSVDGIEGLVSNGTAWGVSEFMERFLGVRWYWPIDLDGRSIVERSSITIDPVYLSDAPVFRKRIYWPPFSPIKHYGRQNFGDLLRSLRAGSSWPIQLEVHTPRSWHENEDYVKNRPDIFEKNQDGTRTWEMLDYAHPMTLQTYLEEIADYVENGTPKDFIRGKTVTVSPADFAVNSYCEEARALWDEDAGRYGQASRIMADFVQRQGEAMLVDAQEPRAVQIAALIGESLGPLAEDPPGRSRTDRRAAGKRFEVYSVLVVPVELMAKLLGRPAPRADPRRSGNETPATIQTLPAPGMHHQVAATAHQIQMTGPPLIPALAVEAIASTARATLRCLLRRHMHLTSLRTYRFDTDHTVSFNAYLSINHRGQVSILCCLSPLFDQERARLLDDFWCSVFIRTNARILLYR
ncbi:hypothetical protein J3R74_000638 [Puniceicoccus vermicola]